MLPLFSPGAVMTGFLYVPSFSCPEGFLDSLKAPFPLAYHANQSNQFSLQHPWRLFVYTSRMCSSTRTFGRSAISNKTPPATKPTPPDPIQTTESLMTADIVSKEHQTSSVFIETISTCETPWSWSPRGPYSDNIHSNFHGCAHSYVIKMHWVCLSKFGVLSGNQRFMYECQRCMAWKPLGNLKWSLYLKHHDPGMLNLWAPCGQGQQWMWSLKMLWDFFFGDFLLVAQLCTSWVWTW